MRPKKYKPGPGWRTYDLSPVCEHDTGVRVTFFSSFGMCRNVAGNIKEIKYPELSRYRKICGGNQKRAIMAWATDNIL